MALSPVAFTRGFNDQIDFDREVNYKNQSETEQKIIGFLQSVRVRFDISQAGENLKRDGWACDGWRVTFEKVPPSSYDMCASESFDFFTGLGHRHNPYKKGHYMHATHGARAVLPHVAVVVHSLILDSGAAEMSFYQWCAEYGFDSDSIKALRTYQDSEREAEQLARIFTRADVAAMRDILADY